MRLLTFTAFLFLSVTSCGVFASPVDYGQAQVTNSYDVRHPNGDYSYSFAQDDGTVVEQSGTLTEVNGVQFYRVRGRYSYTAPDGQQISVNYTADENGYVVLKDVPLEGVPKRISPKAIGSILG